MAIPCFWFSCYFVSGRGTKAWLDVLVTDSAWFMFRWCRDCTGILHSPSFFFNHKAIQKNTHQLHINTKHHFVSLCAVYRTSFWAFQNDGKDCTMISLHRGPSQCGTEGTACPVQGVGHAENGDSKWTRSSWFQQIVSWFCVKHMKTQNHCFPRAHVSARWHNNCWIIAFLLQGLAAQLTSAALLQEGFTASLRWKARRVLCDFICCICSQT